MRHATSRVGRDAIKSTVRSDCSETGNAFVSEGCILRALCLELSLGSRPAQLQVSVSVTLRMAALPQRSVQDAAPRQSRLQEPVHSTSQRAPDSQRTLLLAPTVTSQVEFAAQLTLELCAVETMQVALALQSTLQDSLQVYSQSLPVPQSRLQLPAQVEPQT